jgi:hypothetical protein
MIHQVSNPCLKTRIYAVLYKLTFVHFWITNWKTKLTAETEMKKRMKILGVLQCSGSGEVTEQCCLWLSVLLDMWNIAGTSV